MNITTLSAENAKAKIDQGAILIDIRGIDEHKRENIPNAICIPMSQLQQDLTNTLPQKATLIFHCKSGMRTQSAKAQIEQIANQYQCECFLLEGGIDSWKKAGFVTKVDRTQPIELMRQVQIAAGTFVLLGCLLGATVTPYFYWLSAFVGAGLVFAGVTGICALARVLAQMPWNK